MSSNKVYLIGAIGIAYVEGVLGYTALGGAINELSSGVDDLFRLRNPRNRSLNGVYKPTQVLKLNRVSKVKGKDVGPYRIVRSHHPIQDAAVRDLKGYIKYDVILIDLGHGRGSLYSKTYKSQYFPAGGTLGAERRVGYRGLRAAGLTIAMHGLLYTGLMSTLKFRVPCNNFCKNSCKNS